MLAIMAMALAASASDCPAVTVSESRSITMQSSSNIATCSIKWDLVDGAEVAHKSHRDDDVDWEVTKNGEKVAYTTAASIRSASDGKNKTATMFDCVGKPVAYFKHDSTLLEQEHVALLIMDNTGRYMGFMKLREGSFWGPTVYTVYRCPAATYPVHAHCDGSTAAESQVVATLEQQHLSLSSIWDVNINAVPSGATSPAIDHLLSDPATLALLCMSTYDDLADRCSARTVAAVSGTLVLLLCFGGSCCGIVYALRVYRRGHFYSRIGDGRGTRLSSISSGKHSSSAERQTFLFNSEDGLGNGSSSDDNNDIMDF